MNNRAARQLLARAREVRGAPASPVPSPCNAVCRMDEASGECEGCLRTLDEIAAWGSMPPARRLEVWLRLEARASELVADA